MPLPSWTTAAAEDWLGKTAMNLMLIGVATRKIGRAVRLPEGPLPRVDGEGTSKSAVSRRFVPLSQQRLEEGRASDISKLDLLVIQIDGLHVAEDIVLIAAIGIDGNGDKHILGLVEGARELCLNLGDGADQAAWLFWVGMTSMPSANLTPAMIFGN